MKKLIFVLLTSILFSSCFSDIYDGPAVIISKEPNKIRAAEVIEYRYTIDGSRSKYGYRGLLMRGIVYFVDSSNKYNIGDTIKGLKK